jgi:hypothetical protein
MNTPFLCDYFIIVNSDFQLYNKGKVYGQKKGDCMAEELKGFRVKRISQADSEKGLWEFDSFGERLKNASKVLIGIGGEWCKKDKGRIGTGYEALYELVKGKDYFVVTTNTDAVIFDSLLESDRIVAPCGNVTWRQCSESCTKDIWEQGEIADDICPYCGAPLTGNTMEAKEYIEEGYLPQWRKYTGWLAGTMNRGLLILELGEGFRMPEVIRWPFERTVQYNKKAFLYRVNQTFAQLAEGIGDRAVSVKENSVEWVLSNQETYAKMLKNREKEKENYDGNR